LDCFHEKRVPSAFELLTLMDKEKPAPNLRYLDACSDLQDLGYNDTFDIYSLRECYLATFGQLGRDGARCVHQYARYKFLEPLGYMKTSRPSEEPSIEEIAAPTVQDIRQHNDEGEDQVMKEEEEVITEWLASVIPGEGVEEIEVVDYVASGSEEVDIEEYDSEEVVSDGVSEVASVTTQQEV